MLSFNNLACRRDRELIFSDVNLVIQRGQKVGLTGANGTGKSSLFAIILGEIEPDDGGFALQQKVDITHVAQETHVSEAPAIEFVIDGDRHIRALEQALNSVSEEEGERHASLLADYELAGGYQIKSRAGALLNGLGFSSDQHTMPVSAFSGGWRMRLNLAQALMSPSELLLLDEPTNHLDLDAVLWLENWLRQLDSTLLIISHDREFLDRITSHTLHIEQKTMTLYSGNYSAFESLRAGRLANQQSMFEKQQQSIAAMQSFVDRFRAKATKARQAQSRLKMLERMTKLAPAHIDSPFKFAFKDPEAQPSPLVMLSGADIGYSEEPVLKQVKLSLQSGDRIGLLGANGAGKSTLIKAIVGDLEPLQGERIPAQKLKIGYFAQHQVDQLRDEMSAMQALMALDPQLSDSQARQYLGGFGFTGDQALQMAATMSGGERARLALSLIVYERPNLLLLDEPTNHLDIQMRDALAEALQSFKGALLVVSHDRTLLRSVVDGLMLVADGSVQDFDDDLDGYARWLNEYRAKQNATHAQNRRTSEDDSEHGAASQAASVLASVDKKQLKREQAAAREKLRPLKRTVEKHEKALDKATLELEKIRHSLASNELYNAENKTILAQLLAEESTLKQQIELIEENLLDSMHELELAQADQP